MRRITLVPTLLLALLLTGCASSGTFFSLNQTVVELSEENYEIVATDVGGEATAGYVLGVSSSFYGHMSAFAVARVSGSGMLYQEALADLWASFAEEYGEVEGQELALVNVRYDSDALNLILYTAPTVSVRADVVRFTD